MAPPHAGDRMDSSRPRAAQSSSRLLCAAVFLLCLLAAACGGRHARPAPESERDLQAVHAALSDLQREYFRDTDAGQALQAAWDGALAAAQHGGVDATRIRPPVLAGSQKAALREFDRAYRSLAGLVPAAVDPRTIGRAAIGGLAASVHESHTYYIDPDRWSHRGDASSRYAGIGVTIAARNGGFYVLEVYPNTPAERAGLRGGDRFSVVDGIDADSLTTDQLVTHLRGDPGTQVSVALARGEGLLLTLLTRETIVVSAFESRIIDGEVGYVRLRSFPPATAKLADGKTVPQELDATLAEFERSGVTSWVLDLRNDGGGYLDDMTEVAGRLLPGGAPLFISRTRSGDSVTRTGPGQRVPARPLTVLINGGSASAAEILAAALQESGRARLVGEKSSGVANAANLDALPNGGGLSVTSVQTLTPLQRRPLDGQGVTPEFAVAPIAGDAVVGRDRQLEWAADVGRGAAWPAVSASTP